METGPPLTGTLRAQSPSDAAELHVMNVQHTIARTVSFSGRGLFTGQPVNVKFEPAPANHGIVFARTDHRGIQIPASVEHVVRQERRTTLRNGKAVVETCEHCMSALAGLQIDNVRIEVDGDELPGGDGSARPFTEVLQQAGITEETAPRHRFKITHPVVVREGSATLAAVPCEEPNMPILYELDYGPNSAIGRQVMAFDSTQDDYSKQLAPARTFLLENEAHALQKAGLGKHLSEQDVLVIGSSGPIGGNAFRFQDEPVRHKLMDLIGDLYLLGTPIQGRIIAYRSGHLLNHALVRKLLKQQQAQNRQDLSHNPSVIDVRSLMRVLPHRYPMLLVDRVTLIEGDQRILGVKNVTINEPFFQGHYPGTPIMPGVLVVESMAQLSGVLIAQSLEHTGKLAVLLSLNRVKLRRPVTPGDQLMLEAKAIKVRSRIAQMRCTAYVQDEIAAEAEVKYMLVDDDQE